MSAMPIESAPKDGTKIMIFDPGSPDGWHAAYWREGDTAWRLLDVSPVGPSLGRRVPEPTHWIPLPGAPE